MGIALFVVKDFRTLFSEPLYFRTPNLILTKLYTPINKPHKNQKVNGARLTD
tara:strand:- start:103 stop:258 length:156 start_codon:yes stop_codon:yes gene_type:complete